MSNPSHPWWRESTTPTYQPIGLTLLERQLIAELLDQGHTIAAFELTRSTTTATERTTLSRRLRLIDSLRQRFPHQPGVEL